MPFTGGSDESIRGLSLWSGSSNADPPSGWSQPGFDDSAWPFVVLAHAAPGELPAGGPSPVWTTADPLAATERALFRAYVTFPTGIVNVTLALYADDAMPEVYLNGRLLDAPVATEFGGTLWYGVPVAACLPGAPNLLAMMGQNLLGGPAYVAFAWSILTWDDTGTTDGADVANTGDYGAHLGTGTAGSGPAVRITEPSGHVDWEHDGTLFRVRADDKTVMQTPFPTMSGQPLSVLGKDPATGLPMWSDATARKAELPVDTGEQGQLPGPDSTLPDDPPVSTKLQTDKLLPPVALADPIIDNCPIMRCGAAYYLAQKLKEQYDIVRSCLLGMLAAPLLLRIPVATAPLGIPIIDLVIARLSDGLIEQMGADILWLTRLMTKLSRWMKVAGVSLSVAKDFEGLGEDGNTKLQRLAYPCLTCSENIFNLSQDMLVAWELAINADTAEFTDWQRHLLVYILQATPFGIYHTVAAQGAAITSDTCEGF